MGFNRYAGGTEKLKEPAAEKKEIRKSSLQKRKGKGGLSRFWKGNETPILRRGHK